MAAINASTQLLLLPLQKGSGAGLALGVCVLHAAGPSSERAQPRVVLQHGLLLPAPATAAGQAR
jgi:hypothetical protein